ncbi:MAG TPA: PDZ domain-containing protein [Polyangiaceae bacterium]|nr:PDZ domain-containing protein [Polyangiaceae bacterium]
MSGALGCSAVYPEMKTPVRSPAPDAALDPPPPTDYYFITFLGAHVPPKTTDGRNWVPNPFARLLVDEKEVLVTPTESANSRPTWKDQPRANYRIGDEQTVMVEVWDDIPIADRPICIARVVDLRRISEGGSNQIDCNSGARVWLEVKPARAVLGVGFHYEIGGSSDVKVTRVTPHSPAERAGLLGGMRIVAIQSKPVTSLDALEIRSLVNSNVRTGLELDIIEMSGRQRHVSLREGPIYPLAGDELTLPE